MHVYIRPYIYMFNKLQPKVAIFQFGPWNTNQFTSLKIKGGIVTGILIQEIQKFLSENTDLYQILCMEVCAENNTDGKQFPYTKII